MLFLTALDIPEELLNALPDIQADNIMKNERDYFISAVNKKTVKINQ